jgi:hypothetical protein
VHDASALRRPLGASTRTRALLLAASLTLAPRSLHAMAPEVDDEADAKPENPEPAPEADAPPESETPAEPTEPRQEEPFGEPDPTMIQAAREHWINGGTALQHKRYLEAAIEFERSYAAVPNGRALYNVALAYEYAARVVEALRAYNRYLDLPDCSDSEKRREPCATRRKEVEETIVGLRLLVGELELRVPEGMLVREIRIAGRVVPMRDFPVVLLPGSYDLEVLGAERGQVYARPIELSAGETVAVEVPPFVDPRSARPATVTPTGPTVDPREAAERRARRQQILRVSFWTAMGATGAAGAATATFGGLTLYHRNRYNKEKCPIEAGDCRGYPLDHKEAYQRYMPVTNALIGVTAVLAVTTVALGIFAFTGPRPGKPGRASKRARVGMGPLSVSVRW